MRLEWSAVDSASPLASVRLACWIRADQPGPGIAGKENGVGVDSSYNLIRKDQEQPSLRKLLLDGAASAKTAPADEKYFDGLRERVRKAQGA